MTIVVDQDAARELGFRPIPELDEARSVWPRGARLRALRDAARGFKERFRAQGEVRAVRSFDLATAPYPARFGFHGAALSLLPLVTILNRFVVVQYTDFADDERILVWEPTVPEGSAEAPFFAQLTASSPKFLEPFFTREFNTTHGALAQVGLAPEDVDFASFDHVHVQDMRMILGTTEPIPGHGGPRAPLFPNARHLVQAREWATLEDTHPMQWAWYVPGGGDAVVDDGLVLLDGSVELGPGVAIVWTPGHTDGNHSLVLNTPDGVWVSSENGISPDNWQPELSKIPGIRRYARYYNREIVPNANTLEDSLDQYDSMVLEKLLADPAVRDPRWLQILPSSEITRSRRQWPVVPTFTHGGIAYGSIDRPVR